MTRTPKEKFLLLFETAKRSLLASEAMLKRLVDDLSLLEGDLLGGVDIGERAVAPLLTAISFIDFAHRYLQVVDALPLIKRKAPELLTLHDALKSVNLARNYLQHLRGTNELSSNLPIEYPVFGALGWTRGDAAFCVSFSQVTSNVTLISPVWDMNNACWVLKVEYRVKDNLVDLEGVLAAMRIFYEWLVGKIVTDSADLTALKWGGIQTFAFRFSVTDLQVAGLLPPGGITS